MFRSDISTWLVEHGFDQLVDLFIENEIDEMALMELNESHLKELGLTLGTRVKLIKAISELRQQYVENTELNSTQDAENRQLTVMFCDLVKSTELSQQIGAEQFREVILDYQETCSGVIEKYGGYVARFFGDGILVYFGYPRAYEDDTERAVQAGLEVAIAIRDLNQNCYADTNIELAVRIGLATGPVVVGDIIGEGAAQQSTALGETPNLAARIQDLAQPNSVVISARTYEILADLFSYSYLGEQPLKGIGEPVKVWLVEHKDNIESRFQARRSQRLTPLVGRVEELETLSRRWHSASEGKAQLVLVTGEAGIGKSRILEAMIEQSIAGSEIVLRYQCSRHHQNSALYPVIDHLERAAGFLRNDSPAAKLNKVEQKFSALLTNPNETMPLLTNLLSIPCDETCSTPEATPHNLGPQQHKEQLLAVLNELLFTISAKQPVLVLFEDIHWVDPTTLEFLDSMLSRLKGKQILAIFTYRPGFQPRWVGEANVSLLAINKLDQDQSLAMIHQLTSGKVLPQEVSEQIIDRTDGVPLFVEELTRTVLDSGLLREESDHYALEGPLPALAIPSTLQDSLMARLDRLGSAREIAQIGSVVGREFSYELIQAVVEQEQSIFDDGLEKLVDSGLLIQSGTLSSASYIFRHALIQDTAYASLLINRRRELHARIAKILVERFPELIQVRPELAAYHYSEAGLAESAISHWQKAGTQANRRSVYVEASVHLSTALSELNKLSESDVRDQWKLEILVESITPVIAIKGYACPELEGIYRQALALCDRVGDTPQIYPALYARWVGMLATGRLPLAQQYAYELLEFAKKREAEDQVVMAWRCVGTVLVMRGDPVNSCRYFERVIDTLKEQESDQSRIFYGQDILTTAHFYCAIGYYTMNQGDIGEAHVLKAIDCAESLNHAQTLGTTFGILTILNCALRDRSRLDAIVKSLHRVVEEHDLPLWRVVNKMAVGVQYLLNNDYDACYKLLNESIDAFDALNFKYFRPVLLCFLAEACLGQGQVDQACDTIKQGLEEITLGRDSWFEPELHRIKSHCLIDLKTDAEKIERSFQKAISIAQAQSARLFELRAHSDLDEFQSRKLTSNRRQKL